MNPSKITSMPVFSALAVIGFLYYTTIFVFLEDWLGLQSSAGLLNAVVFTLVAFVALYSFFVCLLTEPGRVPSNYAPDLEENHGETSRNDAAKRCDKCSGYKPPRTHHCRICKRCILKMDHHCIWINNCVGYRNYKAFFLLVLYGALGSIYSAVIFISSTLQREWTIEDGARKAFYIACGLMMVGLSLALLTLLGWHIYLLTHNLTTIEYYEGLRAAWLAQKSGLSYRHLFDVGAYKNITLVLGPNMIKWMCPGAISHLKDGTSFPSFRDSSQ